MRASALLGDQSNSLLTEMLDSATMKKIGTFVFEHTWLHTSTSPTSPAPNAVIRFR
jgi:hypothetical protein